MRYFYGIIEKNGNWYDGALYEVPEEFILKAKILGYFPEYSQLVTLAKQNEIRAIRSVTKGYLDQIQSDLYHTFCNAVRIDTENFAKGTHMFTAKGKVSELHDTYKVYGNVWYASKEL